MHRFHVDNTRGGDRTRYDIIIGRDLILQLGQILEWDETVAPMKETGNLLGQPDLTKRDMWEVVMHNA